MPSDGCHYSLEPNLFIIKKKNQLVEDLNGLYKGCVIVNSGKHNCKCLIYWVLIKI